VQQGIGGESIWSGLNRQAFLGEDRFVEGMQRKLGDEREDVQIPKTKRRPPPLSLERLYQGADSRDVAIIAAHATGEYSYSEIGAFSGLKSKAKSIGLLIQDATKLDLTPCSPQGDNDDASNQPGGCRRQMTLLTLSGSLGDGPPGFGTSL